MAVSVRQFLRSVIDAHLLTADDLREFLDSSGLQKSSLETGELADAFIRAGKLTAYQAQALAAGKTDRLQFGKYVVLARIGAGGMGEVFQAMHRQMERIVALKVILAQGEGATDSIERFRREVKIASRLTHPNIVTAYDADEHEGLPYLVMEYVPGQSLAGIVREHGPLPLEHALEIAIQVAQGLGYAHSEGLIHRDIKPSNVLIDRRGTVKILDLGLARAVGELEPQADPCDGLTHSGQLLGTCHFMSPEQASSARLADERSDIYSLGCTLYCLLTGRPPYSGGSITETIIAHREQPVPRLQAVRSDTPEELQRVLERMLAKNAADRQQSMAQVVAELQTCRQPVEPQSLAIALAQVSGSSAAHYAQAEIDSSTAGSPHDSRDTFASVDGVPLDDEGEPTSPRPWRWIAGAVMAGLVGLALVAFFAPPLGWWRSGEVPAEPPAVAGDPPVLPDPPEAAPSETLASGVEDWTELLTITDPRGDAIAGVWKLDATGLRLAGGGRGHLEVPFVPTGSYEMKLQFTREGQGELHVLAPVEDKHARLWLSGPADEPDFALGLTKQDLHAAPPRFAPHLPHELSITVELRSSDVAIEAALDGEPFLTWSGTAEQLGKSTEWKQSARAQIGLGAEPGILVRSAQVRLIEGVPRPLRELAGHEDAVTCVAFSPNGRYLATGAQDGEILLWKTPFEKPLHRLLGHAGGVTSLAFAHQSDLLVSGGVDATVRLWNVAAGTERQQLGSHDKVVMGVAFHPQYNLVASSSQDRALKLWDLESADAAETLGEHDDWAVAVAFSASGKHLASAGWDATVRVWDAAKRRPLASFGERGEKYEAVAFAPDELSLAAGTQSGMVVLANADLSRTLWKVDARTGVASLAFATDGQMLIVGCASGRLKFYDTQKGALVGQLIAHNSAISGLAWSSQGWLVTCGAEKTVKLWDGVDTIRRLREQGEKSASH